MKVLVTGGAGFIGSHIVEFFQNKADIVVLDNFRSGNRENLKGFDYKLIEADILDRKAVREAVKGVDRIFHMAAAVSVVESMERPLEYLRINSEGTLILLEEASSSAVKKLCLSSSAACYGENQASPKTESMHPDPLSPYAISKLDCEYLCAMFARQKKLKTVSLRYFNVFGPRQDPKGPYAAVIPIFIANALKDKPLAIYGDGTQCRDFVYVKDVAAANAFMAGNDLCGLFNVAYGKAININDLAKTIIALAGSKSEITYKAERPGEIKNSVSSIDKLLSAGFRPSYDFSVGLKSTIEYFKLITSVEANKV